MKTRILHILLALVCGLLIWTPQISNHTEAEDSYEYAHAVEMRPYAQLFHPHHRVYHPLTKWVYELSGAERSFKVLQIFSGICSSLTLLLFYLLLSRYRWGSPFVRAGYTIALAVTYGFWRYAREVEVYPMVWLTLLLALHALLSLRRTQWGWVGMALTCLVAMNVHSALGPVLVLMSVVCLIQGTGLWRIAAFGVVLAGSHFILDSVYEANTDKEWIVSLMGGVEGFGQATREKSAPKMGLRLASIPRAVVGSGACLMGSSPVMAFDPVYDLLQNKIFPFRQLSEERMMAKDLPVVWKWSWLILLIVVVLLVGLLMKKLLREAWKSGDFLSQDGFFALSGTLAYGGLIFIFEPGNPEMWLIGIPLAWFTIGVLLPKPGHLLTATIVGLFAINFLGGIALLNDPERDYHSVTGASAVNAGKEDLYIIGNNAGVHGRFIKYETVVKVLRLSGKEKHTEVLKAFTDVLDKEHRVLVHVSALKSGAVNDSLLEGSGIMIIPDEETGGGELKKL